MHEVQLGPSILTADFLRLGEQLREAEAAGIDYLHLDVMDGHFVPNITFGFSIIEALAGATELPIDVHLMIDAPERLVDQFVEAGANSVTVQVETCRHLHATLQRIAALGAMPGVTLNPLTPLDHALEAIPYVGQVLVMSVNPGFGGQTFIPESLDRIRRVREAIDASGRDIWLQVDGGVKATNVRDVIEAGADRIVAGSAIFNATSTIEDSVRKIRSAMAPIHS